MDRSPEKKPDLDHLTLKAVLQNEDLAFLFREVPFRFFSSQPPSFLLFVFFYWFLFDLFFILSICDGEESVRSDRIAHRFLLRSFALVSTISLL